VTAQGTILYMNGFGAHAELVMGSSSKWNEYLTVGDVMVGVRFASGGTTTTRYFHTDHHPLLLGLVGDDRERPACSHLIFTAKMRLSPSSEYRSN
jgi:hypothetical protein